VPVDEAATMVAEEKVPAVAENAVVVVAAPNSERVPPASIVTVCAVPVDVSLDKRPVDLAAEVMPARVTAPRLARTAPPPVLVVVATYVDVSLISSENAGDAVPAAELATAADATWAGATDSIPANSAVVAVSAMRLRSVDFDICFLSLVRIRNFLNLARRSFDLLIPFPCGTHV
jgi:hypothetical protein